MTESLYLSHILVPIDGSECSRFAAEHALRIAQAYAAEILFVHAVDEQLVAELAQRESDDGQQQVRERLHENGRIYLRDVARLADAQHVPHREQVVEGDPAAVVCETAAAAHIDLIVMGKIGRRGARRILVGSIARRVIESTEVPVLIVSGPPV